MEQPSPAVRRTIARVSLTFAIAVSTLTSIAAPVGVWADVNPGGTANTQIAGTVFHDFNSNGVMNTAGDAANPAIDVGVPNVTVSAYLSGSVTAAATTTSGPDGAFTLAGLTAGAQYRVEFTGLPNGHYPSFHASSGSPSVSSNGTDVQFVAAGTSNVSFGINRPCDYCQANPDIISTRQQVVDGQNAGQPALIQFPYTAGSAAEAGSNLPAYATLLTEGAVGTVSAVAYGRAPKRLYLASHMRRYTEFGPGGPDAIYVVDPATNAVVSTITVPGPATNLHQTADYAHDYVVTTGVVTNTWDAVGKTSLGGLTINDDGSVMYAMNIENRTLYAYNTATGALIASQAVPLTGCPGANALDARPYAVKYNNGALYAGVTCTAESSQSQNDLRILIYQVDPTTLVFGTAPVFSAALNYKRDQIANELKNGAWLPWTPLYKNASIDAYWVMNPQPWLTDITFDGDNLILGLRDRFSDQVGRNMFQPGTNNFINGVAGGDTLRACASGARWVLEGSPGCTNASGGGVNNATISEYYTGEGYSYPPDPVHTETSLGTVLQVPGYPEAVVSVFDPVFATPANAFTYTFRDGVRWMNNTTGAATRGYETIGNDFGKNGSLGDIIALCNPAPIEIGNRVWRDDNGNGLQDAGEPGIGSVTVTLTDGNGDTATTVTAPDGTYYFSQITTPGGVSAPLQPNTRYTLTVPVTTSGGNAKLTTQNAGGAAGNARDSDANPSTGQVSFVTGPAGSVNHDYDFGYVSSVQTPTYSVGNRVWRDDGAGSAGGAGLNNGVQDGTEAGIAGVTVKIFAADANGNPQGAVLGSQVTDAGGYYRFDGLPAGNYVVVVDVAASPVLSGLVSSSGATPSTNTVTDDRKDHGIDAPLAGGSVLPGGIRSGMVTLGLGLPVGEADKTASGQGANGPTGDANDNLTIDFGFAPPAVAQTYSVGNRVWLDNGAGTPNNTGLNNGVQDGTEPGLTGVTVKIFAADANGNPQGTALGSQVTDAGGYYRFDNLPAGNYVAVVDVAGSPALAGLVSSNGATPSTNAAADDRKDHGIDTPLGAGSVLPGGIRSGVITLGPGLPVGEADTTASGAGAHGPAGDANDNLTIDFGFFQSQPAVALKKFVNGYDADAAPGIYLDAGGVATWTYVITNTGNITLVNVALSDNKIGAVQCAAAILGPGQSETCTAAGTAIAGPYVNTGTVVGTDSTAPARTVSATNPANYFGALPNYVMTKYTNGYDADFVADPQPVLKIGDPVTWTYIVTNTGNVPLSFAAGTLVDDKEGAINPAFNLQPGASTVLTKTGKATVTGEYTNTAAVTAVYTPPQNGAPDLPGFSSQTSAPRSIVRNNPSHYRTIPPNKASLGDFVWIDVNHDGQQQAGEPGVAGVTVTLYLSGTAVATQVTNANGFYRFDDLTPGVPYTLAFTLPGSNYQWTLQNVGDSATDSNVNANGQTGAVTLAAGEYNPTVDAGLWIAPTFAIGKLVSAAHPVNQGMRPGEELTFTLLVTNTGLTAAATPVTVTDPLNSQTLTYVANSAVPAQYFTGGTTTLGWAVPNMQPGQVVTLAFRATVLPAGVTISDVITNVAILQSTSTTSALSNLVSVPRLPTAVTLSAFAARPDTSGGIRVSWRTALERNAFGFTVLRSKTGDQATAEPVSSELITAKSPGAYSQLDPTGALGDTYWLKETELEGGTNLYGPVVATAGSENASPVPAPIPAPVAGPNPQIPIVNVIAPVANPGGVAIVNVAGAPGAAVASGAGNVANAAGAPGATSASSSPAAIEARPAVIAASQPAAAVSAPAAQPVQDTVAKLPQDQPLAASVAAMGQSDRASRQADQAEQTAKRSSVEVQVETSLAGTTSGVSVARSGQQAQAQLSQTKASVTQTTASVRSSPGTTSNNTFGLMSMGMLALLGAMGGVIGGLRRKRERR